MNVSVTLPKEPEVTLTMTQTQARHLAEVCEWYTDVAELVENSNGGWTEDDDGKFFRDMSLTLLDLGSALGDNNIRGYGVAS